MGFFPFIFSSFVLLVDGVREKRISPFFSFFFFFFLGRASHFPFGKEGGGRGFYHLYLPFFLFSLFFLSPPL